MMAISADDNYNMEWHDIQKQEEVGTAVYKVYTFFKRVCDDLNIDHPERQFCFTMDNLNIHHSPIITGIVLGQVHRILIRAPYWSVDGPMEYIFNSIHIFLLMFYNEVYDLDEPEVTLDCIIDVLFQFFQLFSPCQLLQNISLTNEYFLFLRVVWILKTK